MPRLCDFSPPSAVILVQCHCEAGAHTGFAIRPRIYPPIISANGRSNPHGRPPHRTHNKMSVGAGGCPPSCQPIPGHCRVRQSGHFLETGSLPLPLAALRRFPRRPELGLYRIPCNVSLRGRAAPVAIRPQSLPCLKGGGPAAGWWRDSCGEESPSHGFAVLRQGGHQPLRRFASVLIPHFPTRLLEKYFLSVIVHPKPNRL